MGLEKIEYELYRDSLGIKDVKKVSEYIMRFRKETAPWFRQSSVHTELYANTGPIAEALFFIACKRRNIPTEIATYEEDQNGFDFRIFENEIPVNVTTNPDTMDRKIQQYGFPTILIPSYLSGTHLLKIHNFHNEHFEEFIIQTSQSLEEQIENKYNDPYSSPVYVKNLKSLSQELSDFI